MSYTPTSWSDRIVQNPLTYTMTNNGDGTYTLTPAPGTITQPGTPTNAANLNKMEAGIAAANDPATILAYLKTVDGAGSGLDADTIDAIQSANLAKSFPLLTAEQLNNTSTLDSGFYTTNESTTLGLPYDWAHILNFHHFDNNNFNTQIAFPLNSSSGSAYVRYANGGAFGTWKKLWTENDLKANGNTLEFLSSGAWKKVAGYGSGKYRNGYSGAPGTSGITVLSVSGMGRLVGFSFYSEGSATVTIIIDGVTIQTAQNAMANTGYFLHPFGVQTDYVEYGLGFESSLVIQVKNNAAGSVTNCSWVYELV